MNKQKQPFNFSEAYFKKNERAQLASLRKFKEVAPSSAKVLHVTSNGITTNFKLESDGEYYDKHGASLTSQLELLARIGNSKVSIYAGERV
jgi:hypothetical protein